MQEKWTTVIKPKTGWMEVDFKELLKYRDLIFLFVKRNFSVQYKQTILGPLWFLINPMITSVIYVLVFGKIAGLSTDGVPQFLFYLGSNSIWQYFASCFNDTSNTFTANAGIFGKVYFPRLTMPIATVIYGLINFGVIFAVSIVAEIYYVIIGANISVSWWILMIPILVIQTALLGLGVGILVSALTTKYRDLTVLVSFGIQLWMYATPVVYTMDVLSPKAQKVILLNPMASIVNNFRYALMGCGKWLWKSWWLSWLITIAILGVGIVLFNKVEKTFMDTV